MRGSQILAGVYLIQPKSRNQVVLQQKFSTSQNHVRQFLNEVDDSGDQIQDNIN